MTQPTFNFQQGDDFVVARLVIDVPTEGVASLRELTQEIERFRVGAEAAARAQDDFVQYLNQTAEIAQRAAEAQDALLQRMQQLLGMQGGGGAMPAPLNVTVPHGYTDPFSGAQAGMGREAAAGAPTVQEVQAQLDQLRDSDPRTYLNMQAARGNLRTGDIPAESPTDQQLQETASRVHQREQQNLQYHQQNPPALPTPRTGDPLMDWQQRISGGLGLANQVVNETGVGGSLTGMLAHGAGLAMSAAAAGGLQGGALANIAKGLGIAGLGISAGLGAYGLVQNVGETYQGLKNFGMVRGGGAAEGLGYEYSIRAMAMSPFLTTEQSRQIIQSALTEGYTGKTFETVTAFMAHNLKEMNLQVADSVELLRKNIYEGGQSIEGLAINLELIKGLSKEGARSLPELMGSFKDTSSMLISRGMAAPVAEKAAMVAGQMYSNDTSMKGVGETIVGAMSSPENLAMMRAAGIIKAPPELLNTALPMSMSEELPRAAQEGLRRWAMQFYESFGRPAPGSAAFNNAASLFHQRLMAMGVQLEPNKAKQLFADLVSGRDIAGEAEQRVEQETAESMQVQKRGFWEKIGRNVSESWGALGSQIADSVRTGAANIGSLVTGKWNEIPGRTQEANQRSWDRWFGQSPKSGDYHIRALDPVLEEYGPGGLEFLDPSGKSVKFDPNNREFMERISKGDVKIRPKGSTGAGMTLEQMSGGGGGNVRDRVTQVQGNVTIDLSPDARKLIQVQGGNTVRLTPHEYKANAGWGDATPNNAPPGESPITRGRSGW